MPKMLNIHTAPERYLDIWQVVSRIPKGCVATYGQIAALAGYPGCARQVGYSLHAMPPELDLPWQRVINSKGEISLSRHDGKYQLQKAMLEEEGIVFRNECIDLKRYRWRPGQ